MVATLSVICCDSTTAADIPAATKWGPVGAVQGYVSGHYAWSTDDWARFPHLPTLRYATSADHDEGNGLDCENGDAQPIQCPGWVVRARKRGVERPVVYVNRATWGQVRGAFVLAKVPEPDYDIADWSGVPHAIPGAASVQFADPRTTGGHYDARIVYDLGILLPAILAPTPPALIDSHPIEKGATVGTPYNPPLVGPFVVGLACTTGGAWLAKADGSIDAIDAPYRGGMNGNPDFAGRVVVDLQHPTTQAEVQACLDRGWIVGECYVFVDAAGERYGPAFPGH